MEAEFRGNSYSELALYKDATMSDDKSSLDISGSSFCFSKAGLPDAKVRPDDVYKTLEPPFWCMRLWAHFDIGNYIDNNAINITLNLKLELRIRFLYYDCMILRIYHYAF